MSNNSENKNTSPLSQIGKNDLLAIDVLIKDNSLAFVIKKLLRLSNAIFYMSQTIKNSDQIKGVLEKACIDINNLCSSISNNYLANQQQNKTCTINSSVVPTVISVLNVTNSLLITNHISSQDHGVISSEIAKIVQAFDSVVQKYNIKSADNIERSFDSSKSVPKGLFDVGNHRLLNPKSSTSGTKSQRQYLKRKVVASPIAQSTLNESSDQNISDVPNVDNTESNSLTLNKRQEQIMGILKDKDNLVIKDISLRVKDCSEKTIQRELGYLVEIGLVTRSGERRWTTYSTRVAGI